MKHNVQCFQFEILNDILFINSLLAKIGLIQSDLFKFCNTDVEAIESYWIAIAEEQRKLELKTILVGVTYTYCSLFNYLMV